MGDDSLGKLISDHGRQWGAFDYVYPVISRRSRGLSVGINLNVDAACNFDCVYCQVDRTAPPRRRDVDPAQIQSELDHLLMLATSGEIWSDPTFINTPLKYRRINDIAFSGDGEPTACPRFPEAVRLVTDLRDKYVLSTTKIVLITNATLLHRPSVREALAVLDEHMGEVWAKLDAGTQPYFERIDRPKGGIQLNAIVDRIAAAGQQRDLVIQSMFCRMHGQPTPAEEFDAYVDRLEHLLDAGCRIDRVQMYTVARQTAESFVSALDDAQLNALADRLRMRLPTLAVEVFYAS